MTLWSVVADSSRAFVYQTQDGGDPELVVSLDHPPSRAHPSELVTGGPGRTRPRHADASRGASMEMADPKDTEADRFAKEVAETLRLAHHRGRFDELRVVAPPRFLGRLRHKLHTDVHRATTRTIVSDWTTLTNREIEERLTTWP